MQVVHAALFAELADLFRKNGMHFALDDDASPEEAADFLAAEVSFLCRAGETILALEILEASEKYELSSLRLDDARAELLWESDRPEEALALWERLATRDDRGPQCVRALSRALDPERLKARLSALSQNRDWPWRGACPLDEEALGGWLVEQIELCRAAGRRDVSSALIVEIATAANAALAAADASRAHE